MNFKEWENVIRSLKESARKGEIRGYKFGTFTILDPESFKVEATRNILKFSDLEKEIDKDLARDVKEAVKQIFVEKAFSQELIRPLEEVEYFCAKKVVEKAALPKRELFKFLKEMTEMDTDKEVEIYLGNIYQEIGYSRS